MADRMQLVGTFDAITCPYCRSNHCIDFTQALMKICVVYGWRQLVWPARDQQGVIDLASQGEPLSICSAPLNVWFYRFDAPKWPWVMWPWWLRWGRCPVLWILQSASLDIDAWVTRQATASHLLPPTSGRPSAKILRRGRLSVAWQSIIHTTYIRVYVNAYVEISMWPFAFEY